MSEFDVVVVEDEDGGYIGYVPDLPGCQSKGDTIEELMENMREAIDLFFEIFN